MRRNRQPLSEPSPVLARETWVEDPTLADDQVKVFQAAFDYYRVNGKWPTLDHLGRQLVNDLDIEEVARDVDRPWVEDRLYGNAQVKLRVAALVKCSGAEPIVEAFVKALQFGIERYFDKDVEGGFTQQMLVQQAGIPNELAHEALLLLKSENLNHRLQGSAPGDWVCGGGFSRRPENARYTGDAQPHARVGCRVVASGGVATSPSPGARHVAAPARPAQVPAADSSATAQLDSRKSNQERKLKPICTSADGNAAAMTSYRSEERRVGKE